MEDQAKDVKKGPKSLREDVLTVAGSDGQPRLMVSRCQDCGTYAFPPRARCASCHRGDLGIEEAPAEGTLYSWTVVREIGKLREGFTPYAVGQVDLTAGLRVMGVIAGGFDSLSIGMRVRTILHPQGEDEDGNDLVGYAFAPTGE